MFKNLLLEEEQDEYSSGEHEERDIQVSISDFDSPKVNIQQVDLKRLTEETLAKLSKPQLQAKLTDLETNHIKNLTEKIGFAKDLVRKQGTH